MKKILSLFLIFILLFSVCAIPSSATSSDWGYNVLSEENKTAELTAYYGNDTEVVFPRYIDGYRMVAVADQAFNGEYIWSFDIVEEFGTLEITKIIIPDTYQKIGSNCFYDLNKLRSVVLPLSIKSVGLNAFMWTPYYAEQVRNEFHKTNDQVVYSGSCCISAQQNGFIHSNYFVKFGTRVIASGAFTFTNRLEMIYIPEGVRYINQGAFIGCDNLRTMYIPSTVERLEAETIIGIRPMSIYIPPTVKYIDSKFIDQIDAKETLPDFIKIYGVKGSAAEKYAELKGVTFIDVFSSCGDADGDSSVTANDYAMIKNMAMYNVNVQNEQYIPSDTNLDGVIDGFDANYIDVMLNQ